jgi:desulfoferrodoxin-like iron-binding protein
MGIAFDKYFSIRAQNHSIKPEGVKMKSTKDLFNRREFMSAAITGAAVLASGSVFNIAAKSEPPAAPKAEPAAAAKAQPASSAQPKIYVCGVCGHVEFGNPPEFCPVCNAEEKFEFKNSIFSDALAKMKEKDGEAKHTPVIAVQKKSTFLSDVPGKEIDVRVGKVMHELETANHIHYIDFYIDDKFFTRHPASPQIYPALIFFLKAPGAKIRAVSFCTAHGYWQAEAQL